jgi:type III secretory pathway component EscS
MPMDKMTKQELWILTAVSLAPIPLLTVVALLVAL